MAPTVPTDIPETLTAGDTWRWDVAFADYPAGDGWQLAYYFRGVSSLDATMGADARIAADGDDFAVTIAAADTAAIAAGTYQFIARATLDGATYTVDSGTVVVLPNAATAAAGALQSHAEKLLAAVEAEIAARVGGTGTAHEAHGILGRNIQFVKLADLYALRNKYAAEVARERHGGKLPPVVIRFGRPSGPA